MNDIETWIVCPNHAAQRWPVYRIPVGDGLDRKGVTTHRIGPRPDHDEQPLEKPRCPECGAGMVRADA